MRVTFNYEKTAESEITIYDEDNNVIDDIDLFENIIDDIGYPLDYKTTYTEYEYNDKFYKIVVESVRESDIYIGFEIY